MAPEADRLEAWAKLPAPAGDLPVWELESTPRLESADLLNPDQFHERLVLWLMNQK
jgi:hypothetical protein